MELLLEDKAYVVRMNWVGLLLAYNLADTITPGYKPQGLTEPIATHPYFPTFAGNWASRKTDISNPDFDKNGSFVKFHKYMPDGSPNPFAGVDTFYQAGLIVTDYRVVEKEEAEVDDAYVVGKISQPDNDKLPIINTEGDGVPVKRRNYLLISVDLEYFNNGLVGVKREWQMSGPKGWDVDIYDYEDTGDASD